MDLLLDGQLFIVTAAEIVRLFAQADDFARKLLAALAALRPDGGQNDVDAQLFAGVHDEPDLRVRIGGKTVDGDDRGQSVHLSHVADVAQKVGKSRFQRLQVLLGERVFGQFAVHFERAHRGDHHCGGGFQTRDAAFDVEEFLRAEVRAEARLGDHIVAELQRRARCDDGIAPVRNVRERSAVDDGGRVFEGLDEVGLQRVLQKRGHCARGFQIVRRDGFPFKRVPHDDAPEARFEVGKRGRKAQNRHDLACDGNVVAVLSRHAVLAAAQPVLDVAELTVVHIHAAFPRDAVFVDAEVVALKNVVVEHGGEQIVRRADGVEIARKVQVDILHGNDLRVAAACRAALHAEHGTERRFAERDDDVFADAAHSVRKTDGRGRLALACGRGRDRRHEHEFAVRLFAVHDGKIDLRLIFSVVFDLVLGKSGALRNAQNMLRHRFLCDLNICFHDNLLPYLCRL